MDKKQIVLIAKRLRRAMFEISIVEGALYDFNCSNLGDALRDIHGAFCDIAEELEDSLEEEKEES